MLSRIIDLAYRQPDGWRIEDHRTDADLDATELRKRYAAQVDAYRRAWAKFTKGLVTADIRPAR